jgi:hypothetical protein
MIEKGFSKKRGAPRYLLRVLYKYKLMFVVIPKRNDSE